MVCSSNLPAPSAADTQTPPAPLRSGPSNIDEKRNSLENLRATLLGLSQSQHLLSAYLLIQDSFLFDLLFKSFETLELFQFRLRLISLFETRVSQKQLVVGLRMRRVSFNYTLQSRRGLRIVASFQRQPGVVVKHGHVIVLQLKRLLQRGLGVFESSLFN